MKRNTMKTHGLVDWDDFKKELESQPGFKEAQEETRLEYEIARALIKHELKKD